MPVSGHHTPFIYGACSLLYAHYQVFKMKITSSNFEPEKCRIIKSIFIGASSKDIRYCVLRNYFSLPNSTSGGDVDLLIHPADKLAWVKHLEALTACYSLELGIIEAHYHGVRFCLFSIERNFFIKLDVHYGEYWRGVQYLDAKSALKDFRKYNKINIPSPSNEAIISLLDPLITGGRTKDKYNTFIANTALHDKMEFTEKLCLIVGRDLGTKIVDLLAHGKVTEISNYISRIRFNLWGRMFLQSYLKCLPDIYKYIKYEVNRRLRPLGALVVLDGSNEEIIKYLKLFETITKERFPGMNISTKFALNQQGTTGYNCPQIMKLLESYNIVICSNINYCSKSNAFHRYNEHQVDIQNVDVNYNGKHYCINDSIDQIYKCVMNDYVMKYQSLRPIIF